MSNNLGLSVEKCETGKYDDNLKLYHINNSGFDWKHKAGKLAHVQQGGPPTQGEKNKGKIIFSSKVFMCPYPKD